MEFDVIVVGGGAMGTAAARTLAERGRSTLLLERFEIGHTRGSSGGPTRIFRLAHEDPQDVRMARLALDAWRELEDRAGERLLVTTGGVDLGPEVPAIAAALEAAGVPAERVPAESLTERWPGLRLPVGDALVQEDAGVCLSAKTLRAQARLAARAGATILVNRAVTAIRADGFGVEVRTEEATYHATIAVVAAGAWTRGIVAQTGLELPLVPTLEQVTYFELEEPAPMPVLIDRAHGGPGRSAYMVPDPDRPRSFKVALHHAGPTVDPDAGPFGADADREAIVAAYARERFAAHHPTGASDACLYTTTPDDGFVLDRRGPLVIGSACSGHGFKFTPLIGRILADLATAQPAPMPIERFLATRSALTS